MPALTGGDDVGGMPGQTDVLGPCLQVVDLDAIRAAGVRIGVDPMGGSGIAYWQPIAERYGLKLDIVNDRIDPTFSFMTLDRDGKIRMDCSSPYAMAYSWAIMPPIEWPITCTRSKPVSMHTDSTSASSRASATCRSRRGSGGSSTRWRGRRAPPPPPRRG